MPDCSPESLLRKVREGFQKRPDKFSKLHHLLFPRFPLQKIKQLEDENTKIRSFYHQHSDSRRSDYRKFGMRPVPVQILYTGDNRKVMLAALPQHMANTLLANEAQVERLKAQHQHRQDRVPNIILKLCEKKKARFLEKHPEAIEHNFQAFTERVRNTERAAELRSSLRGCNASSSTSDLSSIASLSDSSTSTSDLESHISLTSSIANLSDSSSICEPTPLASVSAKEMSTNTTQTDSAHFTVTSATQTEPLPQENDAELSLLRIEVKKLREEVDGLNTYILDEAERRGELDYNHSPQQKSKEKKGTLAKIFSMKKKK